MRLGVIVGRFQVPELHLGHQKLIEHVKSHFDEVCVVVGDTPVKGSKRNPLDYPTRYKMIRDAYPDILLTTIMDSPNDVAWSLELDRLIGGICPIGEVIMFGGRDSFIPHYSGRYQTVAIELGYAPTGTEVRNITSNRIRVSTDFRAGIIYATANQYRRVFPTVDIALVRDGQIVLGRKKNMSKFCFPGGFADQADQDYETAARREALEETGLQVNTLEYICSHSPKDWRYRHKDDGSIMTVLYLARNPEGQAKAADDLDELHWFKIDESLPQRVIDTHTFLAQALLNKIGPQLQTGEGFT